MFNPTKTKLLFIFLLIAPFTFAQEICDNAIDDDADGMIDLNDDECDCEGWFNTIIPNPSFEDTVSCPDFTSQMYCVQNWQQGSLGGSSDYFRVGCFEWEDVGIIGDANPDQPLPGGGKGYTGFITKATAYTEVTYSYLEYVETTLNSPLLAGTEYTLQLYMALQVGEEVDLTIYGSPSVDPELPLPADCPLGTGDWEIITNQEVFFDELLAWQMISLTFTPAFDINAISIGGPCELEYIYGTAYTYYYYLDELTLVASDEFPIIEESGAWCDENLTLTASIDLVGGKWQWYKDGIALIGETASTIDANPYGFGNYSAVYSLDGNCEILNYLLVIPDEIAVDFSWDIGCVGANTTFMNESSFDTDEPTWEWDFGDGGSSDELNPDHIFTDPGTYTVTLTGINDLGCDQTITQEITIHVPNIHFTVADTLGCNPMDVDFFSFAETDGVYTWDFGDGFTSALENPSHNYIENGTYEVTISAVLVDGCEATYIRTINVDINDPAIAAFDHNPNDPIVNQPVQFIDQSINATAWEWNFGDFSSATEQHPAHAFGNEASFEVSLIAFNGICPDTIWKIIPVSKPIFYYVPNAFTPDADEFNAVFKPIFTVGYDPYDYHLSIYNRWGTLIFESYDASKGWNGTYGDKGLVDDGVYIWHIEFGDNYSDEKHEIKGHLTLLQ